jgi:hypothetical protein
VKKGRMNPMQRGRLKNGNAPGDFSKAPRCGARTRRGTCCRSAAMKNGRCRMHGGLSTGPKTAEGLERSRRANFRHGNYSAAAERRRREMRDLIRTSRALLAELR